jgi:hypothetical protein
MNPFGTLEPVNIRDVWQGEASHFTPWLALEENLERLGEALSMSLEPQGTETPVGPFFADIVCRNPGDGSTVLIENQLERTDHRHLGQIFTYAAGLDAVTIVWVSPQFTAEHRAAIDWLNRITLDNFSFFAVEIELWRIGDSPPAPRFNVVAKPNDWSRAMRRKKQQDSPSPAGDDPSDLALQKLAFWEGFKNYLTEVRSPIRCQSPSQRHWMWHSIGRTGLAQISVVNAPSGRTGGRATVRAGLVIHDDPDGSRLEKLRPVEAELVSKLGAPVDFDLGAGSKKSSSLGIAREGNWMDAKSGQDLYQWLDSKHRVILEVVKPMIASL